MGTRKASPANSIVPVIDKITQEMEMPNLFGIAILLHIRNDCDRNKFSITSIVKHMTTG
jgi:hypothetical protein